MMMPTKTAETTQDAPPVSNLTMMYAAMADVRAALPAVVKDAKNPAFKSSYATLGAVQEVANPVLAAHGFVPLYNVRTEILDDGRQIVYTSLRLQHIGTGESLSSELGIIPAKQDAQGIGSAITYSRRYLLTTMLDLTVDDDDGNAASAQRKPTQSQPKPAQQQRPQAFGVVEYGNTPKQAASTVNTVDMTPEQAERKRVVAKMHAVGMRLYETRERWDARRGELCQWQSQGATSSATGLTIAQLQAIVDYLEDEEEGAAD
jgi:hypothetical protein